MSEITTHPSQPVGVKLPLRSKGMEAVMSVVRLSTHHRRRRTSKTTWVLFGLSAWLFLGLISQAAFQLIG